MIDTNGGRETIFDHLGKSRAQVPSAASQDAATSAANLIEAPAAAGEGLARMAGRSAESGNDYVRQRVLAGGQHWPNFPLGHLTAQAEKHGSIAISWANFETTTRNAVFSQADLLRGAAGDARSERLHEIANEHGSGQDESVAHQTAVKAMHLAVSSAQLQLNSIVADADSGWRQAMRNNDPVSAEAKLDTSAAEAAAVFDECYASIQSTMMEWRLNGGNDVLSLDNSPGSENQGGEEKGKLPADRPPADPATSHLTESTPGSREAEPAPANSPGVLLATESTPDLREAVPAPVNGPGVPLATESTPDLREAEPARETPAVIGNQPPPFMPPQLPVAPSVPTTPPTPSPMGLGGGGRGLGGMSAASPSSFGSGLSSPGTASPASGPATPPPAATFGQSLAQASTGFGDGLASGMGASGAVSPQSLGQPQAPTAPYDGQAMQAGAGQTPSTTGTAPGSSAPNTSGSPPSAAAPPPATPGGSTGMMPPMAGPPLAPYSPPGGYGAGPTGPAGAPAAPATSGSQMASGGGAAPLFASAAAGTAGLAAPTPRNPDIVRAEQILADLIRATPTRVIAWAVSVLRSPVGTQVYVASSVAGGQYVPGEVYLPSTAGVAALDPALPSGWADRWMGWQNPVDVLEDHAEQLAKAVAGITVSAIATTMASARPPLCGGDFRALRHADLVLGGPPPVLDVAHQHRLVTLDPALWTRLRDAPSHYLPYIARAIMNGTIAETDPAPDSPSAQFPVCAARPLGAATSGQPEREMLGAVDAGNTTDEEWERYLAAASAADLMPGGFAPQSVDDDESSTAATRAQYVHYYRMARVMELVTCWRQSPPSLADLAYCSIMSGHDAAASVSAVIAALATSESAPRR